MKRYTSNARWPRMDAELNNALETSDEHDTRSQAQGVCDLLMRHGYGGDGKMFPTTTWVGEVEKAE